MTVTLEPCPHCGTLLTPSLVAEIRSPNGDASCPRRPRKVVAHVTPIVLDVGPMDRFSETLGHAAERLLRLLAASEPDGARRG